MGQQLGVLLRAGSFSTGTWAAVRGLYLYPSLPDAAVPLKFGIWDEVLWTMQPKQWFLFYPAMAAFVALAPCRKVPAAPSWVKDPLAYQTATQCIIEAIFMSTGLLLAVVTEQVPAIMRQQQEGLRPEGLTRGFLALLGGIMGCYALATRRI
mmetsp:Transcript_54687/g.123032  ORF Transcript_54687/g.123032 Transcript_54687/m.123032 type:complete len:152 (+) Transcript_54687:95-550(+)